MCVCVYVCTLRESVVAWLTRWSAEQPRVTAGSPLFLYTFKLMMQDPQLRKGMEQMLLDHGRLLDTLVRLCVYGSFADCAVEYNEWNTEALRLEDDLKKLSGSGLVISL
jgi:hypothetical protein